DAPLLAQDAPARLDLGEAGGVALRGAQVGLTAARLPLLVGDQRGQGQQPGASDHQQPACSSPGAGPRQPEQARQGPRPAAAGGAGRPSREGGRPGWAGGTPGGPPPASTPAASSHQPANRRQEVVPRSRASPAVAGSPTVAARTQR